MVLTCCILETLSFCDWNSPCSLLPQDLCLSAKENMAICRNVPEFSSASRLRSTYGHCKLLIICEMVCLMSALPAWELAVSFHSLGSTGKIFGTHVLPNSLCQSLQPDKLKMLLVPKYHKESSKTESEQILIHKTGQLVNSIPLNFFFSGARHKLCWSSGCLNLG